MLLTMIYGQPSSESYLNHAQPVQLFLFTCRKLHFIAFLWHVLHAILKKGLFCEEYNFLFQDCKQPAKRLRRGARNGVGSNLKYVNFLSTVYHSKIGDKLECLMQLFVLRRGICWSA